MLDFNDYRYTDFGGFKHVLFSISYMGCHPKPLDELHHVSRWLVYHQAVTNIAQDMGVGMRLQHRLENFVDPLISKNLSQMRSRDMPEHSWKMTGTHIHQNHGKAQVGTKTRIRTRQYPMPVHWNGSMCLKI